MDIKIPRIKIIRPQHVHVVSEQIVQIFLHIIFWFSWLIPFGAVYLFDKIKLYFN